MRALLVTAALLLSACAHTPSSQDTTALREAASLVAYAYEAAGAATPAGAYARAAVCSILGVLRRNGASSPPTPGINCDAPKSP